MWVLPSSVSVMQSNLCLGWLIQSKLLSENWIGKERNNTRTKDTQKEDGKEKISKDPPPPHTHTHTG